MVEVSEQVFWKYIMNLKVNVHPRIVEPWPYTSIFETLDGSRQEYGRITRTKKGGLTEAQYYLPQ